ncbi:MAG: DUF4340 domain-containing protein [Pseudomonadota bacterium]|nr:DUF4340 domain-containing protein [Pseudomonadota bacterium]
MNRKQFFLLIAVLVILGGLVWALKQRDKTSWSQTESRVGQTLLKNFQVNDVAVIHIDNGHTVVNLVKKEGQWRVSERGDYPANFNMISDLLLRIQDQKIIQSDTISAEQRPPLELIEPNKDKPSATSIEMKDGAGKTIAKLLLGKRYTKKGAGGAEMPAGRYVMVAGDDKTVALIDNLLLDSEPKPETWLNKDFVRADKIKAITFKNNDSSLAWKMVRDQEAGEWRLADAQSNDKFDSTRGTSAVNAISMMSFNDVVASSASLDTGMDKPRIVVAETFDGLTYTFRVGKEASDDNQYVGVTVSGEPVKERVAAASEKPEDKKRLDKEFKERLAKLETRLKFEKTLSSWTYVTPKWRLDPLLKNREGLMMDKQNAEAPQVTPINPNAK